MTSKKPAKTSSSSTIPPKMNTKPLNSQLKNLNFATRILNSRNYFGLAKHSRISATLNTRKLYTQELKTTKETSRIKKKNPTYEDNFFAKIAINHLSKTLQDTLGVSSTNSSNKCSGYDNLVYTATKVAHNLEIKQQHELVLKALNRAFPAIILSLIKVLFPPSRMSREIFAVFTTIFFGWLVGPSQVREIEVNGRKEKSVVFIEKCRFLDQTNCVGMCTHLCKIPSQIFIKNSLGMPIYMMPDFDDLSCKMMFGEDPPEIKDDPVMKQPCFKLCKSNKNYGVRH